MKSIMNNRETSLKNSEENPRAPLLDVRHLSLSFLQYQKGLYETKQQVIEEMDITVNKGEVVAVVGASGSGKSLLAHAIVGILPDNAIITGEIYYKGSLLTRKRQRDFRGREISLIPQSVDALNPLVKIDNQVHPDLKAKDKLLQKAFERVGLNREIAHKYPFELSGGMARRVLVTTAMLSGAHLIIADEPTPGLDPEVLHTTLKYLKKLSKEGKGIMFITHDLHTAIKFADKVAVIYAGQIVEVASANCFSGKGENLNHPYTKALWNALPQNDFSPLPGLLSNVYDVSEGCIFQSQCPLVTDICKKKQPESREIGESIVRCHHA